MYSTVTEKPHQGSVNKVWYGMVWYGMVWYGMVWYGMVWYGMALYFKSGSQIVIREDCHAASTTVVEDRYITDT